MAEKRMFAKTIIDSDAFLDMPTSAQALYFHLCMRADDEGFINSANKIRRMIGASQDDLDALVNNGFIIRFDSGIVVIKHWKIHNAIKADRIKPTTYAEEASRLTIKSNKAYSLDPNWKQNGNKPETDDSKSDPQIRLDKISIDKIRLDEESTRARAKEPPKRFTPPTTDEVSAYAKEKGYLIDADRFVDFYASKGWLVGKSPMKDWKAAVRNWALRDRKEADAKKPKPPDGWEDIDQYFHKAGG